MSDNQNPIQEEKEQEIDMLEQAKRETSLAKKSLKLIYVYAIATGAIFTFMGYWDTVFISYCGPATFVAFALMTVLILPIAFVYCELAPMFPQVGAELVYNTVGLNKHLGFLSAWMIMAAWISVPPAAVMAILQWIFRMFGYTLANLNFLVLIILSIIVLAIYMFVSLNDVQIAGKIQLFMLMAAIAGCILTGIILIFSGHWSISNYTPFFRSILGSPDAVDGTNFGGWFIGLGLIITPYFGFETVPQMVEEGSFPIKDSTKAIWGSVVTCGIVYTIFYGIVAGVDTWENLIHLEMVDGAPSATVEFLTLTAMDSFGGGFWSVWSFVFGLTAVFFAICTCLLGFWLSTVRLLYAMGRQNFLPASFAYVNKHHQPIVPNILLFAISVVFILLMNAGTFMNDFFNLMAFGCAVTYFITCCSAMRMKSKYGWQSPYVLKGGMFTRALAAFIALFIAVLCTLGQGIGSWINFGIYIGIGLLLWLWMMIFKWPKTKVTMLTPDGEKEF